jgi:hypothetical protein
VLTKRTTLNTNLRARNPMQCLKVKHTNTMQLFSNCFQWRHKTNISERRPCNSGVATSCSTTTLLVQLTAHSVNYLITRTPKPIAIRLTNCTDSRYTPSCKIHRFIFTLSAVFLHSHKPADWQNLLIPGDGEHLVPILDPLFVSEFTVNEAKLDVGISNVMFTGLQGLELLSIR